MIFNITLKHFAKLLKEENPSNWTKLLLSRKSNKHFQSRSLDSLTVGQISSLEIYLEEHNYYEFCRIFVCKKWYETICIQHWPLILQDYIEQKTKFDEQWKEVYYYIFNPPQYGMPGEETQGSMLRQDFVNEFGNWVVLTDLILSKQPLGYKEIEKWNIIDFLFWANYYSGQQIIEKVK
jgi:hypothetical protein